MDTARVRTPVPFVSRIHRTSTETSCVWPHGHTQVYLFKNTQRSRVIKSRYDAVKSKTVCVRTVPGYSTQGSHKRAHKTKELKDTKLTYTLHTHYNTNTSFLSHIHSFFASRRVLIRIQDCQARFSLPLTSTQTTVPTCHAITISHTRVGTCFEKQSDCLGAPSDACFVQSRVLAPVARLE